MAIYEASFLGQPEPIKKSKKKVAPPPPVEVVTVLVGSIAPPWALVTGTTPCQMVLRVGSAAI